MPMYFTPHVLKIPCHPISAHTNSRRQLQDIELDGLGKRIEALFIEFFESASLPDVPKTVKIQALSSVLAQESPFSASLQAIMTSLPSKLRAQALNSLCGKIVAGDKTAGIEADTSSSPSYSKSSTTTAIPTVTRGAILNHSVSGGTKNSTTSAPIVISTTQTIASDSATQDTDADVAFSTLKPSTTPNPNVGMIQPTAVLNAAGAFAVGVVGMMIFL